MKKTIAAHMLDVLEEEGKKAVHLGVPVLLDRCYERVGSKTLEKLNLSQRNQRILNALEKSPFFKKTSSYAKKNNRCYEIAC